MSAKSQGGGGGREEERSGGERQGKRVARPRGGQRSENQVSNSLKDSLLNLVDENSHLKRQVAMLEGSLRPVEAKVSTNDLSFAIPEQFQQWGLCLSDALGFTRRLCRGLLLILIILIAAQVILHLMLRLQYLMLAGTLVVTVAGISSAVWLLYYLSKVISWVPYAHCLSVFLISVWFATISVVTAVAYYFGWWSILSEGLEALPLLLRWLSWRLLATIIVAITWIPAETVMMVLWGASEWKVGREIKVPDLDYRSVESDGATMYRRNPHLYQIAKGGPLRRWLMRPQVVSATLFNELNNVTNIAEPIEITTASSRVLRFHKLNIPNCCMVVNGRTVDLTCVVADTVTLFCEYHRCRRASLN